MVSSLRSHANHLTLPHPAHILPTTLSLSHNITIRSIFQPSALLRILNIMENSHRLSEVDLHGAAPTREADQAAMTTPPAPYQNMSMSLLCHPQTAPTSRLTCSQILLRLIQIQTRLACAAATTEIARVRAVFASLSHAPSPSTAASSLVLASSANLSKVK